MVGNKEGEMKLAGVLGCTGGDLIRLNVLLAHGRVRLKAAQHGTSQQHTQEESPSLWCIVRDDHGRRLVRTRTVRADKVRATGPEKFKSASQPLSSTATM